MNQKLSTVVGATGQAMTNETRSLSRRMLLAGAAGATVLAATGAAVPAFGTPAAGARRFPKNFRWGVATAAHQIEGNNLNADYWLLENLEPTAFAERSGDACDSYHRYEEDIALLAGLGFNSYRFSLEWARIEPTRGQFSTAELDYYKRVIECCLKHRIDPAVTFMHATTPRWFAMAGGWLNPEAPALFARFCSTAAKALAGDMRFAFTINEPQVSKTFRAIDASGSSYFAKHDELERAAHAAAARATGSERFVTMSYPDIDGMTPQLIAGHEQGFAAIKAESSILPVGVTLNIIDFQPGTEDSPYQEVRQRAYGDWLECVRRAGDFVGVQIYRQIRVAGKGAALPTPAPMPYEEGGGMMSKLSRPEALRNGIDYIYEQTHKPILITENGIDTDNDVRRIWYIDAALASVQESIARGVPVLGYFHWSLLDNFEWEQGYKTKYGLVAVDRTTFKRTPKPSAAHLGKIARSNGLRG
jgi:beta-glucosidase